MTKFQIQVSRQLRKKSLLIAPLKRVLLQHLELLFPNKKVLCRNKTISKCMGWKHNSDNKKLEFHLIKNPNWHLRPKLFKRIKNLTTSVAYVLKEYLKELSLRTAAIVSAWNAFLDGQKFTICVHFVKLKSPF